MSRSPYQAQTQVYFYLLPALIILIVFAYTFISYQKDVTASYNANVKVYNKKTVANNKKGREIIREMQEKETAQRRGIELPSAKKTAPAADKEPQKEIEKAPDEKDGKINLCRNTQVKTRQSSLHQSLRAFGPEKAIDGEIDPSATSSSISATQSVEGEKSWWMIDLGKDSDHSISEIVIHAPVADHPIGVFSNFRIILVNKEKKIVAEKEFHTDNSPAQLKETWVLDNPVEARGVRIETLEAGRPVIISELEIYGKE